MKKTLITAVLLASVAASFAQGTLTVGNNFTGVLRAPIYGQQAGDPTAALSGQSANGVPTGSTAYTGPLLAGTGYTFALFAGPGGTTDPAVLQLITTTTFRTGTALPAGTVFPQDVVIPGVPGRSMATLEVRVWDNLGGTVATWAQVLQNPNVARGTSGLFQSPSLGGAGTPPDPPAQMTGWTSFNVHQVPEPSVIALGALGLGALLLRRRKS